MTLNSVTDTFADTLRGSLPPDSLRQTDARHIEEPRGRWFGRPGLVALPRTPQEVSAILKAANAARIGVVPYGGGTGLVSGQIMEQGPTPLLVSLERMNKVRALYPAENVAVVEAGVMCIASASSPMRSGPC